MQHKAEVAVAARLTTTSIVDRMKLHLVVGPLASYGTRPPRRRLLTVSVMGGDPRRRA
jgi:hypothetical protein